jgi:hypothetical protein
MRWALLPVVLLLITGCFGHSEDTAAPTRAEYVKQANSICRESSVRLEALGRTPAGGTARYRKYVRDTSAIARAAMARLRRLRAPASLQPMVRELEGKMETLSRESALLRKATAKVDEDIRAGRLSSTEADAHFDALSKAQSAMLATLEQIDAVVRRMGLTECARYN